MLSESNMVIIPLEEEGDNSKRKVLYYNKYAGQFERIFYKRNRWIGEDIIDKYHKEYEELYNKYKDKIEKFKCEDLLT